MASTFLDAFTGGLFRQLPTSSPVSSESRNRGKKRNKKKSGQEKVLSRCNSQVSECGTFVQENCADAACLAAVTVCCDLLGTCDFTGFIACVNDATAA